LFHQRTSRRKAASRKVRSQSTRPALELLEDRHLLSAGTWTPLTNQAPSVPGQFGRTVGTMMLLSNGSVMVQGGDSVPTWYNLTPDSTGSFINGTWSQLKSMSIGRLYDGSAVLPNGDVFVVGGEYTGVLATQFNSGVDNTAEIYNPVANTWTPAASFPQSDFADDPVEVLPNGNVLAGYVSGPQTYIYNPTLNSWSPTGTKLLGDRSDEEAWVKLPDGSILSYDIFASLNTTPGHAQRYIPSTGAWVDAGTVPVSLSSNGVGDELGPALLLPNGNVFQIGGNSNTAIYNPTTNTWIAGPTIPGGHGADDAPAAILPDGHVIFAADVPLFNAPTQLFDYDPVANTITQMTLPAALTSRLNGTSSFIDRMVMLPNGDLLLGDGTNQLWEYTPPAGPTPGSQPTISSVVANGAGAYTLTGTQFNGISEGSSYGDDVSNATNYPIVQLSAGGKVYYARTSNWSSTGVATGATPETTQFTLPAGLPFGQYSLTVIANGIASAPTQFNYQPTALSFAAVNPLGSLVYQGMSSGDIAAAGATNTFTFSINAGQTLSAVVTPTSPGLKPTFNISGPTAGGATASAAGQPALQQVYSAAGGAYTITVGGASNTTGNYSIQVYLNAAIDSGSNGGPSNNTLASAQDLTNSFETLTNGLGSATRADVVGGLIGASAGVKVGYYTDYNTGDTNPATPITAAGDTPVQITTINGFNLNSINILMIDESNNGTASADLTAALPAIQAWVQAGGVVVTNDRSAGQIGANPNPFLFGDPGAVTVNNFTSDLEVIPPGASSLINGPFGTLTTANMSGGNFSSHGYVTAASQPAGATDFMSNGPNTANVAALSYSLGSGRVYYATIPLDFYLDGAGNNPPKTAMTTIYAPNMLAYGATFVTSSDYYKFAAAAGDNITIGMKELAGSGATIQLLTSGGTLLASGVAGSTNLSQVISNYAITSAGTYIIEVTGTTGQFNLVLTDNASFDTHPNGSVATAQDVTNSHGALGAITGSAGGLKVGYYTDYNSGDTNPATPITAAGDTPVQITTINGFNLNSINILMIDESNNGPASADLTAALPAIQAWVQAGGVVETNDRSAGQIGNNPNPFMFGDPGAVTVNNFTSDLEVIPPGNSLQINGPFGTLTTANMSGGNFSAHGYVTAASLPAGTTDFMSNGPNAANVASLSYSLGSGRVYYAAIPLDFYLDGAGNNPPATAMTTIYAPNMLAYGASFVPTTDYYKATLAGNQTALEFETSTPYPGPNVFTNTLNPQLELLDASGNPVPGAQVLLLADGRNEELIATGLTAGATYVLQVSSANGCQGEYFIAEKALTVLTSSTLPIQVDDNQANNNKTNGLGTFTLTGISGSKPFGWNIVSAAAAFHGSETVHAPSATDTADATWSYTVINNTGAPKPYTIYASWAAAQGNATNATYKIYIDQVKYGPVSTIAVDQTQNPNTAVFGTTAIQLLSTIAVPAGPHTILVVLSDVANGNVVADGVFDPPATDAESAMPVAASDSGQATTFSFAAPLAGPTTIAAAPSAGNLAGDLTFNSLLLTTSPPSFAGRFDDAATDSGSTVGDSTHAAALDEAFGARLATSTDVAALDQVFAGATSDAAGSTDLTGSMDAVGANGAAADAL